MVRILFLFIFLLNIVFFFWEYRRGAPGIYLPPNYEVHASSNIDEHKIVLISKPPVVKERKSKKKPSKDKALSLKLKKQNAVISKATSKTPDKKSLIPSAVSANNKVSDSSRVQTKPASKIIPSLKKEDVVKAKTQTRPKIIKANIVIAQTQVKEILPPLVPKDSANEDANSSIDSPPIVACYQLQEGEYTQETFAQSSQKAGFNLKINELSKKSITRYLVLAVKSKAFEDAEKLKQKIKQQGIGDLWLFKQGGFNGRVSLGLFSSEEKAELAKQAFSIQTDHPLEVVASYQTSFIKQIKISTPNKQDIVDFQRQYATIIDQEISCAKINLILG